MSDESNAIVPVTRAEMASLIPSDEALLVPHHKDSAPPERGAVAFPYVGFRGAKSTVNVEALTAAGITVQHGNGQFYLMVPPVPIKVDPMQLHVLNFARFYTKMDESQNIIAATVKNDDDLFKNGFRESLYAVVAVVLPEGQFEAATLQLRGANTNALKQAIQLLGEPGRPGPATNEAALKARGKAWADAAALTKTAGARFITTIYSTAETPQGGGQKFNQGHGSVRPSPVEHVKAFEEWRSKNLERIKGVWAYNAARVEYVRRIAAQFDGAKPAEKPAEKKPAPAALPAKK